MSKELNKGNRWKEKNKIFSNPSELNAYKAYNYFINKGLTPAQASGIVGNLAQESSIHLKTGLEEVTDRKDKGYGIAQWTFGRRTALEKYAKGVEKPVNDINVQLDFLWQELNTTEKKAFNALKNAQSPEQAAEIFHDKFERSADKKGDKNYNRRLNYANQFHSEFSGVTIDTPQPTSIPNGNQVDEEEFMKAFKRANELQQQEEYRQQQAIAENEYKTQLQNKINQRNFMLELANQDAVDVVEYNKEAKFQQGGMSTQYSKKMYPIMEKELSYPILRVEPTIQGGIEGYAQYYTDPNSDNPDYSFLSKEDYLRKKTQIKQGHKDYEPYLQLYLKNSKGREEVTVTYDNGGIQGIPVSSQGVYDYPEQNVLVPTDGNITMKNVEYPILGVSLETGQKQMMFPDRDYFFENTNRVLEIPQIR